MRGIRLYEDPSRPSPFYVQWRSRPGASPKTKAFKSAADRQGFVDSLIGAVEERGRKVLEMDPVRYEYWLKFEEQLKGRDPYALLAQIEAQEAERLALTKEKASAAIEAYLSDKKARNAWDADTLRHRKTELGRFADAFAQFTISEIQTSMIQEWIDTLAGRGGPVGNHVKRSHRKSVVQFFNERFPKIENPAKPVKVGRVVEDEPYLLTPEEAAQFFEANKGQWILARVALEAFGFLRTGSAARIERAAIDLDQRTIRIRAGIQKSGKKDGRPRFLENLPENLWKWIEAAKDDAWAIDPERYSDDKAAAMVRAGLRPWRAANADEALRIRKLKNVWRHSCITYHLASFQNRQLAQELAQHADYKETDGYRGLARKAQGDAYFAIVP